MKTPGERARYHVASLLLCWLDAETSDDREEVAAAIAELTPGAARPLAQLAQEALAETLAETRKGRL